MRWRMWRRGWSGEEANCGIYRRGAEGAEKATAKI
jgi:hypothetical protein